MPDRIIGFTPGPWLIEEQGRGARGHWFQRAGGEYIAMSCKLEDRAEEDANARLIASAPRLFELLERALWALDKSGGYWGGEDAARALLSEIRGEQVPE